MQEDPTMTSGCRSAAGCIEPLRATYANLYRWPESDLEFVRSVVREKKFGPGPAVVHSYSCRQMFLRSYTFSKKETVTERTRRCFDKVKERAADLPFIRHKRDSIKSDSCAKEEKKKKKKVSCSVIRSIFHRLLACTTTVDVVDSPE